MEKRLISTVFLGFSAEIADFCRFLWVQAFRTRDLRRF